ncbi:MAG: HEAT repeat domain-containing protein [Nitrospirota bacterium]
MDFTSEQIAIEMQEGDVVARLAILKTLSERIEDAACFEIVMEAMGDSEWQIRKEAVAAMAKAKKKGEVVQKLLDRINKNDNVGRRNAAADLFVQWGKASVPALLLNLKKVNDDTRKVVIDVLGDIRDPQAISPLLIEILGDDSLEERSAGFADNLRSSALEAIGKIRPPEGVLQVIPFLKKGNSLLTFSAIKALELIGSSLAVPHLIEISKEKIFKRAALEALGAISDMKALPCLLDDFHADSESIRRVTLKALLALWLKQGKEEKAAFRCQIKAIYNEQDYVFLVSLLEHSDPLLKRGAIQALGWVAEVRVVSLLIPFLVEYDLDVVESLSGMGRLILPELSKLLERGFWENEKTRHAAAMVWGALADVEGIPFLLDLLRDNCASVREAAAVALGKIGKEDVIPSLMNLLDDPYPEVQEAASRSLLAMQDALPMDQLVTAMQQKSAHLRANAAALLAEVGYVSAISNIVFLLKDQDEGVRRAAVNALGKFPHSLVLRPLLSALGDEDYKVRVAVLKVLEEGGGEAVLDDIASLLHDDNMWVRAALARTVGRAFEEKSLSLLLKLVKDPTGVVQIAALTALGQRQDATIFSVIVQKLSSEDRDVKKAAILALGEHGNPVALSELTPILEESHWALRAAAVSSVARLSAVSSNKIQDMADSDEDPLVRDAARFALSRTNHSF